MEEVLKKYKLRSVLIMNISKMRDVIRGVGVSSDTELSLICSVAVESV